MGDVRDNLDKAFAKRNPNRKSVAKWVSDHPDREALFREYVGAYLDMKTDSSHKFGVATLLDALRSDESLGFSDIGTSGLRNWLSDEHPDE